MVFVQMLNIQGVAGFANGVRTPPHVPTRRHLKYKESMVPTEVTKGMSPELQQRILMLRKKFIAGLGERWDEIEAARNDQAQRVQVLHRLAGAALAFGFDELGDSARIAEAALRESRSADEAEALACLDTEVRRLQASRG